MAAPATFVPRATFAELNTLTVPRSYYLGHHAAGLARMKSMLERIDLVIECRDYRIPNSSRNPLLEDALAGRSRIIVYTKHDLGWEPSTSTAVHRVRQQHDSLLRATHPPHVPVHYTSTTASTHATNATAASLLASIKRALPDNNLTGHRILVAGMPNVGKSTLLNALRAAGDAGKGKAARTGAQPGITRAVGSAVKIVDGGGEDGGSSVYLLDTPGVFVPRVGSARGMLHLALCGCVKDALVPPETLVDYLLFRTNLQRWTGAAGEEVPGWDVYARYAEPTNDVVRFLEGVARGTGRLKKGGVPDMEAAAQWWIRRWRSGEAGRFVLEGPDDASEDEEEGHFSLNQARKLKKENDKATLLEKQRRRRGE